MNSDFKEPSAKRQKYEEQKRQVSPFDLLTMSLNEPNFYLKLKACPNEVSREMTGQLISFDEHMNVLLSDAIETVSTQKLDPISNTFLLQLTNEKHSLIFIRGDQVIYGSPSKL